MFNALHTQTSKVIRMIAHILYPIPRTLSLSLTQNVFTFSLSLTYCAWMNCVCVSYIEIRETGCI